MDTQTTVETVKKVADATVQNQDLITKLQNIMQPMADKIGQGAQFGWDTVVQQQIVWGWVHTFLTFSSLVSIFSLVLLFKKLNSIAKTKEIYYNDGYTAGMLFCVIGVVGLIVSVNYNAIEAITHLLNPNYYAIQFFVDLVSNNPN